MSRYNEETYRRIWGEAPPEEPSVHQPSAALEHPSAGPVTREEHPGDARIDHVFSARLARIETMLSQILDRLGAMEGSSQVPQSAQSDPYESPPQR